MNLLKKLTNKNLELNRKRTIVTIIGIILSVALITAVATLFVSFYNSLVVMEIHEEGNYHVSFLNVPVEDLKIFDENRYIEKYYVTEEIGYAKLEGSKNEDKPYLFLTGYTKDSLNNLSVNLYEGRLPENNHELIISRHIKTNGRVEFKVGDKITLNVGKRTHNGEVLSQSNPYGGIYDETHLEEEYSEELIDTQEQIYTIVGIMERPPYGVEDFSAPGYTCATLIEKPTKTVSVYARFTKKGLDNADYVIASILDIDYDAFSRLVNFNYNTEEEYQELQAKIGDTRFDLGNYNKYLTMLERGIFKYDAFYRFAVIIGVISFIIVIVSVFCIKNSFDISIAEKTKQYGMLSSIGATKKQIKKNVYYEAFKLGVVGIPLGVILGLIASAILIVICNLLLKDMLQTKLIFQTSYLAILFGIVLGIITIWFSSMYSAQRASRITPIKAIRNSEDIKINPKKIKSPKIIKKIFGIGGEISYKNIKRSKKKYRTTIISIIVCVTVYIALSTFMSTFYQYMTIEYEAMDHNIEVYVNTDNFDSVHEKMASFQKREDTIDYSMNEEAFSLIKNPKFTKVYKEYVEEEPFHFGTTEEASSEFKNGEIEVVRIGDHQYRKYLKELKLDYENNKDKVIIVNQVERYSQKAEKEVKMFAFEYKKGETITLGVVNHEEGDSIIKGDLRTYEIASVTNERPFGLSFISYEPLIIMSDETFRDYYNQKTIVEKYYFESEKPDTLQDDLEKAFSDIDIEVSNLDKDYRMMKSLHLLIAIFLYGFVAVIALIGITSIFNTITTNMELRKREFATLKSVGMTTKEFNRMISLESFFYGTKSLLIGIPLGILLSYWLSNLLNEGEDIVKYQIPFVSIFVSIIIVFLLITIIMKYSITKINKQNTIETIRNENI